MEVKKAKEIIEQLTQKVKAYRKDKHHDWEYYFVIYKEVTGDFGLEKPLHDGTLVDWADEHAELYDDLRVFLQTIIETFDQEGVFWYNSESQGGQDLAELLAKKHKEDIPLFLKYMASMDLDHEVGLGSAIKRIWAQWPGEEEATCLENRWVGFSLDPEEEDEEDYDNFDDEWEDEEGEDEE